MRQYLKVVVVRGNLYELCNGIVKMTNPAGRRDLLWLPAAFAFDAVKVDFNFLFSLLFALMQKVTKKSRQNSKNLLQ
jgi:hypothetical protein